MYRAQIGIVAEGPTDKVVIDGALDALLSVPYVSTLLQPDETQPKLGRGWGGVFRWMRQTNQREMSSVSDDPLLSMYDLIVIHLDADVCASTYGALGDEIEQQAKGLQPLPCDKPCPPGRDAARELERVIQSWVAPRTLGDKATLCIPSRSIEVWLAVAVLPLDHQLIADVECQNDLDRKLASLPISNRVKKTGREYRRYKDSITAHWGRVREVCSQADEFSRRLPVMKLSMGIRKNRR